MTRRTLTLVVVGTLLATAAVISTLSVVAQGVVTADLILSDGVEHVLMHASKVHPQIRQEFESGYAVWWRRVKYSNGGFASGTTPARRAQLAKVDNRVIIGSAATTPESTPDWMKGAVAAGWQALKSLHDRAMRGLSDGMDRRTEGRHAWVLTTPIVVNS
jgi:monoamine oxidase